MGCFHVSVHVLEFGSSLSKLGFFATVEVLPRKEMSFVEIGSLLGSTAGLLVRISFTRWLKDVLTKGGCPAAHSYSTHPSAHRSAALE